MKEFLRCLSLSIQDRSLIVPYSAVAEVIPFKFPKSVPNVPKWLLGEFRWREKEFPLLYLEMMGEPSKEFVVQSNLHIAVLNRITEAAPDFMGVVLQKVPTMTRFKRTDIEFVSAGAVPSLLMEVKVRNQIMFIPNMRWIEESLLKINR